MRVIVVAGARPNFIKVAPLLRELDRLGVRPTFVHTGQHYDRDLSEVFFRQLALPEPGYQLGVGSGSHAEQTAAVMVRFDEVLRKEQPHLVMVVGDVNSTLACAVTASKFRLQRPFACSQAPSPRQRPLIAHIEAGLRSGDFDMPEEINRRLTDAVSDLLFTTEAAADANLLREGVPPERVHFVGNVMIDTLDAALGDAVMPAALSGVTPPYVVLTLHRPSNVDSPEVLTRLLAAVGEGAQPYQVVFPCHPRTRSSLAQVPAEIASRWHVIDPLGYLEFLGLIRGAHMVCTDSGGLQEETTALGVPCVTLRNNTERPVTVTHGTNTLAGTHGPAIVAAMRALHNGLPGIARGRPPLWDGRSAERIARTVIGLAVCDSP